jgi:hypothetical protein
MKNLLLTTALVLILGALPLPIGYYTILRILVCIAAVSVVINDYKGEIGSSQILFGIIAIIFNPLIPVYLHNKSLWVVIDLVAGAIFFIKAFSISSTKTA